MPSRLLQALIETPNEAADEVLLEALRVGSDDERAPVLGALIRRQTTRGLGGVIETYDQLPETLKIEVLNHIKCFHHALRECGRSDRLELRLAALRLIALGRQGKLAYAISENLHHPDERISKAAVEAMVALARWVSSETRRLQRRVSEYRSVDVPASDNADPKNRDRSDFPSVAKNRDRSEIFSDSSDSVHTDTPKLPHADTYRALIENRPEIEAAVARAMEVHRGRHGQQLLRAALLLCDWPGSRTLAILQTMKHGGQSGMVRRLQQPPASEHVEAFLLGASHGGLRSHFGIAFSHIDEAPVLNALLRKTHWLKDHQLQLCMHQVNRGAWWGEAELARDLERRPPAEAVLIGEWLAVSGIHDVMQDQRMDRLREHAQEDFPARLRLLRIGISRRRGASVHLIRSFLSDPDERLVRMAARELVRRKPMEFENALLQLMTTASPSVRRVIARSIGHVGFDQFWNRFDRLDRDARRQAGRAMLKLLPDALQRLARRLGSDPAENRIKAMQIVQELGLAEPLAEVIVPLCQHPSAKVRSKAVSVLGEVPHVSGEQILDRAINDADPRVRANALEVMEMRASTQYVPILAARARSAHHRERANAIKAMHRMRVSTATTALAQMLRDDRPEHRISALWALRQIGWWQLLNEVARLAKADANMRVRRYALNVLKSVADQVQAGKERAG